MVVDSDASAAHEPGGGHGDAAVITPSSFESAATVTRTRTAAASLSELSGSVAAASRCPSRVAAKQLADAKRENNAQKTKLRIVLRSGLRTGGPSGGSESQCRPRRRSSPEDGGVLAREADDEYLNVAMEYDREKEDGAEEEEDVGVRDE